MRGSHCDGDAIGLEASSTVLPCTPFLFGALAKRADSVQPWEQLSTEFRLFAQGLADMTTIHRLC